MSLDLDINLKASENSLEVSLRRVEALLLEIAGNTKKVDAGLDKAGDEAKTFGTKTEDAGKKAKFSFTELDSAINLVTRGFGLASQAVSAIGTLLDGYVGDQTSLRQLTGALQSHGIAWADAEAQVNAFAEAQGRSTRYGADATREMLGQFASASAGLNLTVDQMIQATGLVEDIVERTGKSGADAARAVANVYAGHLEALNELLPGERDHVVALNEIENASDRATAGTELLTNAFGGSAENIDEMDLQLAQVRTQWGEAMEEMGRQVAVFLLDNNVLPRVTELLGDAIGWLTDHQDEIQAFFTLMKEGLSTTADIASGLVDTLRNLPHLVNPFSASELGGGDTPMDIPGYWTPPEGSAEDDAFMRTNAPRFGEGALGGMGTGAMPGETPLIDIPGVTTPRTPGGREPIDPAVAIEERRLEKLKELAEEEAEHNRNWREQALADLAEYLERGQALREEALDRELLEKSTVEASQIEKQAQLAAGAAQMREAEAASRRASEQSYLAVGRAAAAGVASLLGTGKEAALFKGAMEVAESFASFAILDFAGGIQHGFAAAAFFAAAGQAGKGAAATGGGAGRAPVPQAFRAPSTRIDNLDNDRSRAGVTVVIQGMVGGPFGAGQVLTEQMNRSASLNSGLRLDPGLFPS